MFISRSLLNHQSVNTSYLEGRNEKKNFCFNQYQNTNFQMLRFMKIGKAKINTFKTVSEIKYFTGFCDH